MLRVRVIPSLLLRRRGLVKTIRFSDPSYVGDPINVVKIFNEKGVDELMLMDIGATRDGSEIPFGLLEEITSEAFMPVAYGGAVRTVDDARRLLKLGVEKVCLNSAALEDLSVVRRIRDEFGAQCVVGVVDVRRDPFGRVSVHSHAGIRVPERDPLRWAEQLVEAGAGEIFLQNVDRDGTLEGYDLSLLRRFRGALPVPLIVGGGAGPIANLQEAVRVGDPSALAMGARCVYYGPHRAVLVTYLGPGELEKIQEAAR